MGNKRKAQFVKKVAYHEAAHAVIARVLGIDGISIEILPDGRDGTCDHGHAWPGTNAELAAQAAGLDKDLLMNCAGAAAEKRLWPDDYFCLGGPWDSDSDNIEVLAAGAVMVAHGQPAPAILDWDEFRDVSGLWDAMWQHAEDARARADRLVAEHWPAIARVAGALLAKRVLDQVEIDALIAGRPKPKAASAPIGEFSAQEERQTRASAWRATRVAALERTIAALSK